MSVSREPGEVVSCSRVLPNTSKVIAEEPETEGVAGIPPGRLRQATPRASLWPLWRGCMGWYQGHGPNPLTVGKPPRISKPQGGCELRKRGIQGGTAPSCLPRAGAPGSAGEHGLEAMNVCRCCGLQGAHPSLSAHSISAFPREHTGTPRRWIASYLSSPCGSSSTCVPQFHPGPRKQVQSVRVTHFSPQKIIFYKKRKGGGEGGAGASGEGGLTLHPVPDPPSSCQAPHIW